MSDHVVNGRDTGAFPRATQRRAARGVPPSADVAEASVANVIGKAVALELGKLLAEVLPHPMACAIHTARYKQVLRAWQVACQNAVQAAEEPPEQPEPGIPQAFTMMPVAAREGQPPVALPVCFECFDTGPDVRPVGLVDSSGTPIVARG